MKIFQFGLRTAYQNKTCLDPFDPECPQTAPNYRKETEVQCNQFELITHDLAKKKSNSWLG